MARDTTLTFPEGAWFELTAGDVASITFQNLGGGNLAVKATVGAVVPTDFDGSFDYNHGEGEFDITLSTMAPGIAATRVYAYPFDSGGKVTVSHA